MFEITKTFTFEAAHQLIGLMPGHKCANLHGHSYTVKLKLRSPTLDNTGFVIDYGNLSDFKAYIDEHCDHRILNSAFPGMQPSAESLARHFFEVAARLPWGGFLVAVEVCETGKTSATYFVTPLDFDEQP